MKPLYSKIIDAYVDDSNDTITIKEKVIFTSFDYDANGNISKIKVYKDNFHKTLIDEVDNNTNNQIEEFNIDNYLDEAITVTYKFSLGDALVDYSRYIQFYKCYCRSIGNARTF